MQEMRLIGLQEKKARDLLVLSDESWKINHCELKKKDSMAKEIKVKEYRNINV